MNSFSSSSGLGFGFGRFGFFSLPALPASPDCYQCSEEEEGPHPVILIEQQGLLLKFGLIRFVFSPTMACIYVY